MDTYRNKFREKKSPQQELALQRLRESEPKKKEWIRVQDTVLELQTNGDLLLGSALSQILVRHYPQTVAVGQMLDFHAHVLQSQRYRDGHFSLTVDFGVPYDPWALKKLRDSRTNVPHLPITNTAAKLTNAAPASAPGK